MVRASHLGVLLEVLAAVLPVQVNQVLASLPLMVQVGGAPAFCLRLDPELAVGAIWGMSQQIEDLFPLLFCLLSNEK